MSTLGDKIKQLRKKKDLTQDELASIIHVNRATLANWEINRAVPDPTTLQLLADFFNVSVDYLLGRTDDPNPGQHRSTIEEDWPEVTDVLRRCGKKPTPEERRRIARIIKAAIEDTDDI
ncbi:helix-turn-helix domain-containing protein [Neomoorella humiferrea]|uniref:HTH-type transcriptional regulator Xre n=1 Tax=Neomoorella humiferrea TaxID=676965 RepID=A0A2T0AR27_9FIRM|nr:helix-turn-helix transcriptional regulator [Moorella humiferrea]PRR71961.1 HTH-type transcriptional regulator Xre [Moorella humiferrea]